MLKPANPLSNDDRPGRDAAHDAQAGDAWGTLPKTLPGGRAWPQVSVVIIAGADERAVEATVASVQVQAYPAFESVVVTGSQGRGRAIGEGVGRSTGEILVCLEAGERLAPGALAAAAMAFDRSPRAQVVAGVCELHGKDGRPAGGHLTACPDGKALPLDDLLDLEGGWAAGQFFRGPEVFFARSLWDQASAWADESLDEGAYYELWLRFAAAGATVHVVGRALACAAAGSWEVTPELVRARDEFLQRTGTEWRGRPAEDGAAAKRALRVAFVNDHGFQYGAGIAHARLAAAVALGGHEVAPIALSSEMPYDANGAVTTEGVVATIRAAGADVVVLGNVHSAAVDGRVVEAICREFPSAFVLHDCWMLTGRCAYTGTCDQLLSTEGCDGACPTWEEYPRLEPDRVLGSWRAKRELLHSGHAPALLANSRWMLGLARQVLGSPNAANRLQQYAAPSAAIRLAFPVDVYRPRDKRECRRALGLPEDRFLVLFSASSLDDKRKGVAHLVAAMERLQLPDATAVCVGRYDERSRPALPDLRVMGYMTDPDRLSMLYSAVDLFVGPSVEEALGQVFVEAAACGTPSVGYPVGGVPEAVADGVTGRVAAEVTPAALAAAIRELYDDERLRRDMGKWARLVVENEWSTATALHRWHTALRETGLGDRVGLPRGIRLESKEAALPGMTVVPPENPSWRALDGFGGWEGPYPHWNLPRCRWALGPGGRIEIHVPEAGAYRLMVECLNGEHGQRLSVYADGRGVGERDIPVTHAPATHVAAFDLTLKNGANVIEFRHAKWTTPDGSARPQAVLVTRMACVRWHGAIEGATR